jgi:hypothetical protein
MRLEKSSSSGPTSAEATLSILPPQRWQKMLSSIMSAPQDGQTFTARGFPQWGQFSMKSSSLHRNGFNFLFLPHFPRFFNAPAEYKIVRRGL